LLTGEIFPRVNFITTSRRRIEGFSIANPTFGNVAEGTAIALFNTNAFVSAFDTTIYPITSAMEIGLDFEDDSPVNMGQLVGERFGVAYLNHVENLLANGTGTNQMLGLFNTSGLTAVTSALPGAGPKVNDYEALLFAVKKEYRQEAGIERSVFLANETSYSRCRGIEVGVADARRMFDLNLQEDYRILNHPYLINHNVANTHIGFFCLNRYRGYRRAGYNVRVVTEDQDLALKNLQMVVIRARMGGQFDKGAAGAIITDARA
jgi:HK97 family phage major capsid protein